MKQLPLFSLSLTAYLWFSFALLIEASQDENGNPVLRLGDVVPIDTPNTYYSDLHPCPASCLDLRPSNWTVYTSTDRLALCSQPMLFDLAISVPVDDPASVVMIRACTVGDAVNANTTENALFMAGSAPSSSENHLVLARRATSACLPTARKASLSVSYLQQGPKTAGSDGITTALKYLRDYFNDGDYCDISILFSYSNGTVAGIYLGPSFDARTVSSLSSQLQRQFEGSGSFQSMAVELCGIERNANHVVGIAIDTTGDVALVQKAVRSWTEAKCVTGFESSRPLKGLEVWESMDDLKPLTLANSTPALHRRADCKTIKVVAGDSCGALASRCGISAADFTKYNPSKGFCSGLQPGQRVCCSSGTLPDISPKPGPDGVCATYLLVNGDTCAELAASNGITTKKIEEFNDGTTWAWNGCRNLLPGVNICLSKGKPPMPAPVSNAVCGPTKPGTKQPSDNTDLADLNPCPLNVCCNIWGQCGITEEFCLEKRGPSKNPGTSPPGTNGCVSSCGLKVVNNDKGPSSYGRVGYYESWNFNRECLNLGAISANTDGSYTHMHWAFAEINTADWTVKINDTYGQWEDFTSLGLKRIISFGGWGYSTEPETYNILREAMSPANRATFATNVATFLTKEGIDGVDFDWEYPGALDIPGTPPGTASDGPNYLKFLSTMRSKLPKEKTLSIAAPASYWYLKAFPIKGMASLLDYIVYMTYDLHGQWDAGNQWASEGCPTGNCLRSHVNLTETTYALAMITKAGVPANKVFVGESSYGRSFKMSKAGCTGPTCTFEGDRLNSKANPGDCTTTPGYIANAEIDSIKSFGGNVKTWHDGASNSDIVVYDDTEWVAYMSETTKTTRRSHWRGLNFAGTIDWAVDLQSFTDDDIEGPNGNKLKEPVAPPRAECKGSYSSIDAIQANLGSIPEECVSTYILEILYRNLTTALTRYDDLIAGVYNSSFNLYADAVVDSSGSQVNKFMQEHGNDYFTCVVTEQVYCCSGCHQIFPSSDTISCRYCEDFDCGWDPICDNPEVHCDSMEFRYRNMSQPCPPDFSMRGQKTPAKGDRYTQSVYWKLRANKAANFWADIYSETGIEQKNIGWRNEHNDHCSASDKHCADRNWNYNYPHPVGYDREDVIDPKDVVSKARQKLEHLAPQLGTVIKEIKTGRFMGDVDDLVDALSLPISMISDAVDNMHHIIEIADEIREQKSKAILLAFLSAIFFFIPIIGEVASTVQSLATIGRIVSLLGATGNAALDIYTIMDDKENVPLAIFGLVLAPLALFDAVAISKAANTRRGMSASDIKKLGGGASARMNSINQVRNVCRLK